MRQDYNEPTSRSSDDNVTPNSFAKVDTPIEQPMSTENNEVINDGASQSNNRPRRANAGTGTKIFEPTWGKKHHLEYKKKCFLQQKREERNTNRARISLFIKKERKRSQNKVHLMQLVVNQVFLIAQMSAHKDMKLFGERTIAAIIKECEQLDRSLS